jgi:exodeoxyribonuclease V gamma subunit
MIHLHYSNRLEALIAPLAQALTAARHEDPLKAGVVIVPNLVYAEFLKLRLAELSGVAANLRFPFLNRYLSEVIAQADPTLAVLDTTALQLGLFECLRAAADHPALEPLRSYIGSDAVEPFERELRQLRLSQRIAMLLREYAISRPEVLARWRREESDPAASTQVERWQHGLYRLLFTPEGALRERYAPAGRRWFLLPDAFAAVQGSRLTQVLATPLHIFGIAYAGAEFVRMFARIAVSTELHVYCINPCLEFWEDVRSSSLIRGRLVARGSRLGAELVKDEDPFAIAADENLALSLWSRPGREYIRLLNELAECDFEAHFVPPLGDEESGPRLLRLQQAILMRQPAPAPRGGPDRSIRILACPGIRREAEIVANAIWSLIKAPVAAGMPALRFHQIAVLVPDHLLPSYLPHLRTVFDELHGIPLNLAGQVTASDQRLAEAIELLVRLPAGNLSRVELLHLLTHPAMGGDTPAVDSQQWGEWCAALGVYFGADENDMAGTYIPREFYHWDQALRRLALGLFLATPEERQTYQGGDESQYVPHALAQDEAPSAARLIHQARALLLEALDLRQRRFTPAQWCEVLRELVTTHLHAFSPAAERTLSNFIGNLQTIAASAPSCAPLGYATACELVLSGFAEAQAEMGHFAESGVVAGAMSALRSLPFRAIFVMGMGEDFPVRDTRDPLDLRNSRRYAGDVSANQRDRYLFLEALLAAREYLTLSYVARDEVTGEPLQPSPLVAELGFALSGEVGENSLTELTEKHPASRYDRRYFPDLAPADEPPLAPSFDPRAHRGARLAALREELHDRSGGRQPELDLPELIARLPAHLRQRLSQTLDIIEVPVADRRQPQAITLSLSALRHFLECPLQGVARYRLGMLDDDDDDEDDEEDEPLMQPFLARLGLLREAFWHGKGDEHTAREWFERELRFRQMQGQAPAGPFFERVRRLGLSKLERCVEQARASKISDLARWQRIRFGAGDEFVQAEKILDPIALAVPMRDGGTRTVRLQGTVTVSPDLDAAFRCVAGKSVHVSDFLEGYLAAFALAAAGILLPPRFRVIALGFEPKPKVRVRRSFGTPSQSQALAYLTALARELLDGDHRHFMPIEAVEKIVNSGERDAGKVVELIEKVRRDEFNGCRSDYGPLRDAREYEPPSGEQALAMIERHFGPIRGIFGDDAKP